MVEQIKTGEKAGPADQLMVRDPTTLKVLSNPLRVDILRQLGSSRTVKEIAEILGFPRTKLYYHVNLLEEHGLIQVVDTQLVSGIVEKQYQLAAREFRVDRALLVSDSEGGMPEVLACMFDGPRQEVQRSVQAGLLDFDKNIDASQDELALMPRTHLLARLQMRLTPAQFEHYHHRLMSIVAEVGEMDRQEPCDAEDSSLYGLMLAFYPLAEPLVDEECDEEQRGYHE